jgi:NADH-quinone oxidoreductase subunit H
VALISRNLAGILAMALGPLAVALVLVWSSREVTARLQGRIGRAGSSTGPFGLTQSLVDTLKLLARTRRRNQGIAPTLSIVASLAPWAVIPLGSQGLQLVKLESDVLYIVAIGGLLPLAALCAAWTVRGTRAEGDILGAAVLAFAAEIPRLLGLMVAVVISGSLALQAVVRAQTVPFLFLAPVSAAVVFAVGATDIGRPSRVLAEAGAEISGAALGAIALADVLRTFTAATIFTLVFLGGWRGLGETRVPLLGPVWLLVKALVVFHTWVFVRAATPRLRTDQVLALNWSLLTPLGLVALVVSAPAAKAFGAAGLVGANVLLGVVALVICTLRFAHGEMESRRRGGQPNSELLIRREQDLGRAPSQQVEECARGG